MLFSLVLLTRAAAPVSAAEALPELQIHGMVHELMTGQDEGAAAITLTPSSLNERMAGLGALAGRRGELTIVDGRCWLSLVGEEGIETSSSDGAGVAAGLLVLAEVESWVTVTTSRARNLADLADQVRARAATLGLSADDPLVFRVDGALPRLKGHVADGSSTASGECPRSHSASSQRFPAQQGVLLGFVSSEHEGVLTHRGETIHVHALLQEEGVTIHVDELKLSGRAKLQLGTRSLTAREWVIRAAAHYWAGEFAESADSYAGSLRAGAQDPTTFYNASCSAALAGRKEEAFQHLDGALERGFRDSALLSQDSDLHLLHDDPRWDSVLQRCDRAAIEYAASLGAPELREELLEMRRIDQAIRSGESIPETEGRGMGEIDAVNTARMKEIVAEHGWLVPSLVGEDGARSAWLLEQHADQDPVFQRECLELMTQLPSTHVDPVDLAYLTDRVLVNEGGKQLYGTQFWTVDGELVPRPIEDPDGVEARRSAAGMISMADYTERMTGRR